jgi:hypothetical protein
MVKKTKVEGNNAAGQDINTTGDGSTSIDIGSIQGGQNIIGVQGGVHVYAPEKKTQRIVVQPGPEHIDGEQKVELQRLREEWIDLHNNIKKKPLDQREAWVRINRAAGATSYHLILRENFDKAVAYIRREIAMLRNMRSAPAKDDNWRLKRIAAIKLRSKNQLGDQDAYKAYIKKNFSAGSLSELSTDELQRTYSYIMGKK